MKWSNEHKQNAKNFSAALKKEGFDFFTGVPCSLLGSLIAELSKKGGSPYIPAVREDAALGMASGAFLAGKLPAVLIQNSGLGYSLNVLTSLNLIYKIPVLCIVSFRGYGPDAPEHLVMGRNCLKLLDQIGIGATVPGTADLNKALFEAKSAMIKKKEPYAIFIKKGIFGD